MKLKRRKHEAAVNRRRRVLAAALLIPCPKNWCSAPAGSWCYQTPGEDVGVHEDRWRAAQEHIDQEDSHA